jgi:hypothetical protein
MISTTNRLRDTVTRRFYYEEGVLAVQPEASNLRLTAESGSPSVTVTSRDESGAYLRLRFGSQLAAGKTMNLTLTFDLADPGGAPDRPLRVSPSLIRFQAWARTGTPDVGGRGAQGMGEIGRALVSPGRTRRLAHLPAACSKAALGSPDDRGPRRPDTWTNARRPWARRARPRPPGWPTIRTAAQVTTLRAPGCSGDDRAFWRRRALTVEETCARSGGSPGPSTRGARPVGVASASVISEAARLVQRAARRDQLDRRAVRVVLRGRTATAIELAIQSPELEERRRRTPRFR